MWDKMCPDTLASLVLYQVLGLGEKKMGKTYSDKKKQGMRGIWGLVKNA